MKLSKLIELIDRRTSWGKEQLKAEILALVAQDIDLVYTDSNSSDQQIQK